MRGTASIAVTATRETPETPRDTRHDSQTGRQNFAVLWVSARWKPERPPLAGGEQGGSLGKLVTSTPTHQGYTGPCVPNLQIGTQGRPFGYALKNLTRFGIFTLGKVLAFITSRSSMMPLRLKI